MDTATDRAGSSDSLDLLDQGNRVEPVPIDGNRHAPFEFDLELAGSLAGVERAG